MREQILYALDYPRNHIRQCINFKDCIHSGNFNSKDCQCHLCDNAQACQWLIKNDDHRIVAKKSQGALINALKFAFDVIDEQVASWNHNIRICQCDTCKWLKKSEKLLAQLEVEHPYSG